MARIIVSAGHTNDQPGTVANGVREVDLTRKIAGEITKELRKNDVVTLSVPPNLDLARRIAWINQTGYTEEDGDIAIEIHINEGGKSGVEGWHQADKTNSIELTRAITNELKNDLSWKIQGIKSEYEHELGSLAFLHNTNPIASLVECGYIDNEEDLKILKNDEGIRKIANAIVQGVLKHIGKSKESSSKKEGTRQKIAKQQNNQVQPSVNTPTVMSTPQPLLGNSSPSTDQFPVQQTTPMTTPGSSYRPGGPSPTSNFGSPTPPTRGSFSNPPGGSGGGGGYMSREDRKEMIKKNYVKILGREPSQSDLNYFLNLGTNEDQLIKRMIDSQEHADLVKARQEVIKTKETLGKQTSDILYLRTKVADQQGIIKNLNQLLIQKNRAIYRLNLALRGYRQKEPAKKQTKKVQYKRSTSEKFLDFFSDKLGS